LARACLRVLLPGYGVHVLQVIALVPLEGGLDCAYFRIEGCLAGAEAVIALREYGSRSVGAESD
jgi:hypothetical protein